MSTPVIRQAVGAAASGANAVVTLGAGTAVGDLLLIFHGNDFFTAAGMPTPTSSQTLNSKTLQATADQGTNQAHLKLWTAIVTVAGTQTVTGPVSSTEEVTCQVIVIDGSTVDTANFIDNAVTTGGSTTSSTSHVAPAVSPVTADALLVCSAQSNGATGGVISYTPPGGMTEQTDVNDGAFCAATTATLTLGASGTTGTKTFTCSASQGYATISIAVKGGASSATGGTSLSSARPGKTWNRRFHHHQQPLPDTSIVAPAAAPGIVPILGVRRRWARRIPPMQQYPSVSSPPPAQLQPPKPRSFRGLRRRMPFLATGPDSFSPPTGQMRVPPKSGRRLRRPPRLFNDGDAYSPPPNQQPVVTNPAITQLTTGRFRLVGRLQPRGRVENPLPVQAVAPTNPSITQTVLGRYRRVIGRRRPLGGTSPAADQAPPPQVLAPRRKAFRPRYGRTPTPVPTQQAAPVNPSITQLGSLYLKRFGWRRYGRVSNPTPAQQAAPVNPSITKLVTGRSMKVIRALRRPGIADTPTPAQQTPPSNPPITQLVTVRARQLMRGRRRTPVQADARAQATPPPPLLHKGSHPTQQRRGHVSSPLIVQSPPPPEQERRRPVLRRIRRAVARVFGVGVTPTSTSVSVVASQGATVSEVGTVAGAAETATSTGATGTGAAAGASETGSTSGPGMSGSAT